MPRSSYSKIKLLFILIVLAGVTGFWTFFLLETDDTPTANIFNTASSFADDEMDTIVSYGKVVSSAEPDEFAQYYETMLSHQILLLEERAGIFRDKSEFVDEIAADILNDEIIIQLIRKEEDAMKYSYEIMAREELYTERELEKIEREKDALLKNEVLLNAPVATVEEGISLPDTDWENSGGKELIAGNVLPHNADMKVGATDPNSENLSVDEMVVPKITDDNKVTGDLTAKVGKFFSQIGDAFKGDDTTSMQLDSATAEKSSSADKISVPVTLDETSIVARADLPRKSSNKTDAPFREESGTQSDLNVIETDEDGENPFFKTTDESDSSVTLTTHRKTSPLESVFEKNDVIAFYGNPRTPVMGIIGQYSLEILAQKLKEFAFGYDEANGERGVIPCFYLIYGTCWKGGDIGYLETEQVVEFIEFAQKNNWLVILDHQIGKYSVKHAVSKLLPFLQYDNVHLALDPEWKTENPMKEIGSITADEINDAREQIETFLDENSIGGKRFLIIHQFNPKMIRNSSDIENSGNTVELVHSMDGFGSPDLKRQSYDRNVQLSNIPLKSFKLFSPPVIKNAGFDNPMMSPKEVLSLDPPPVLIMLQ
ncbi:MAG: hypothetical protein IIW10_01340 [Spirochaetaceae bacterium]|nr:hypothetical protein [Spirochaetaceae bacterium]